MKVAARRIRLNIRNLVDDLHKRVAKWVCEKCRCVVIPKFQTSQMMCRGPREMRSKSARAMCTWSDDRFRPRLLSKAGEYPWCEVVMSEEAYSSRRCGACVWIGEKVGGVQGVEVCDECG